MIARFGMLECGKNFKNSIREICDTCNVIDDENHRLNHCIVHKKVNFYDANHKVNFSDVFSSDLPTLRAVINEIEKVWDVKNAHGTMNK